MTSVWRRSSGTGAGPASILRFVSNMLLSCPSSSWFGHCQSFHFPPKHKVSGTIPTSFSRKHNKLKCLTPFTPLIDPLLNTELRHTRRTPIHNVHSRLWGRAAAMLLCAHRVVWVVCWYFYTRRKSKEERRCVWRRNESDGNTNTKERTVRKCIQETKSTSVGISTDITVAVN